MKEQMFGCYALERIVFPGKLFHCLQVLHLLRLCLDTRDTLERKYPDLKNIGFPSVDDEVACLRRKPVSSWNPSPSNSSACWQRVGHCTQWWGEVPRLEKHQVPFSGRPRLIKSKLQPQDIPLHTHTHTRTPADAAHHVKCIYEKFPKWIITGVSFSAGWTGLLVDPASQCNAMWGSNTSKNPPPPPICWCRTVL